MKGEVLVADLRKKSDAELLERQGQLKKEIFEFRGKVSSKDEVSSSLQLRAARKEIAQILTILTERKRA